MSINNLWFFYYSSWSTYRKSFLPFRWVTVRWLWANDLPGMGCQSVCTLRTSIWRFVWRVLPFASAPWTPIFQGTWCLKMKIGTANEYRYYSKYLLHIECYRPRRYLIYSISLCWFKFFSRGPFWFLRLN